MTQPDTTPAAAASTSRRLRRVVPAVLFYGVAIVVAVLMWPTTLGGCTTLTVVTGHSMEPTYYTGDLVLSRCGKPAVGDVVVYRPAELDGPRIIHRIIGGDGVQGWDIQGDNNPVMDPFNPTDAEVLGIAALHVPQVGRAVTGLSNPYIWLSLCVLALALVAWPSRPDEPAADDGTDDGIDDGTDGATVETPEPEPSALAVPEQRVRDPF